MQFRAIALATLLGFVPASRADDPALLRCRLIADAAQRLACYDAIVIQASAASPARPPAEEFGLPSKPPGGDIEFIESTLEEEMSGWRPDTRFRLANGQVWQVADDSSGFIRPGTRKLRIRRGALGAYFLEVEGSNRSPRVRRVL